MILSTFTPFRELLPIVRGHHERLDGSGYPDKLKADEICIGARIIAVADSFDAMVSNRVYRPGLGVDRALQELIRSRGVQFDGEVVDAFLRMMEEMGRDMFCRKFCAHTLDEGGKEPV